MGFKKVSEIITISGEVDESAANTFTQLEVSLDLDPISREIFVITDAFLDPADPSTIAGTNTTVNASLSTESRTSVGTIANSNTIMNVREFIYSGGVEFNPFRTAQPIAYNTTGTSLDYVAIISTSNFFAQVVGGNNTAARSAKFRLQGYRAKADADTYAALVASSVLSS